ncbi:MAG TPA: MBL fold metallo-hydrolase [Terriglobia bacterium]|nr:MBL fold metallo-hydrolase [Terriglobia bacterium]
MKVRFWGVRGSIPTPALENLRYGGNTPCLEVRTSKGRILIFDGGSGLRLLGKQLLAEFGHKSIEGNILLTHFHWDHIQGFPFFEPLYNPENHFHFHSFHSRLGTVQEALEGQMSDPYFPVNMSIMQARRHFHQMGKDPLQLDDAVIRSIPLNHPQGCLGYRVECDGNVLVYATDNEPGSREHDRNVRELARNADVLIYDAQYTPYEYSNFKRGWGHSTWREGVNIAEEVGVRQLILFHHDPDHNDVFIDSIVEEARKFFPNVLGAWEGLEIDLALGQHHQPQEQSERRLGSRQSFRVPLRIRGTRPDGTSFEEDTTLENLSVRGAFFLLDNEPDPNQPLQVEILVTDGSKVRSSQIVESRVTRNQDVKVANQSKRGIGVSFV